MGAVELRVAVIGAGIGGLSLGLALRERGIAADVFEQAPAWTEIGAAIALSANATRAAASPLRWGLFAVRPLLRWYRGRAVLILRRLAGAGGCRGAGVRAEDGMGQDDVLAALAEVLADVARIDPADVTPRAWFDDLGIDSLTMVDVVVAVEDRFGLVIPDDEWARFETVSDASAHVQRAAHLPR